MNQLSAANKLNKHLSDLNISVALNGTNEIKILNLEVIKAHSSIEATIDLMASAFSSISRNNCHIPLRSVVENPEGNITLFFKPAFDNTLDRFVIKLLSQSENNHKVGLPTITGMVLLLDSKTGEILSLMDGKYITALRTGAVGGLASKYLSRDVRSKLAIFGCGVQGRTQMQAVLAVREVEKVFLYDNNPDAINSFIEEMQPICSVPIEFSNDLDALAEVDIISTATGSADPLFKLEHLKPGVHINAIGSYKPVMQEISPDIIQKSSLFVDQRKACLSEPGDILIPLRNGMITEDHIKAELGDVIEGKAQGRISSDEITVFKSVGIAIQDLYLANDIYNNVLASEKR